MSYQRFKKGGRVAKSPFLEKSVQKLFNKKKIKTDFFQKSTFFESPITHKRFIFSIVKFHMVNVKRVVV